MEETFFSILIFVVMFLLANIAERSRRSTGKLGIASVFTYGSVVMLHLALLLGGLGAQLASSALKQIDPADLAEAFSNAGLRAGDAASVQEMMGLINANLVALGLWLPALLGLIFLLKPVRRMFSKILPSFDPDHHVHTIALSLSTIILTNLLVTLGIGLDTLTNAMVAASSDAEAAAQAGMDLIGTAWVQNLMFVVLSMVGVGWLTRRGVNETLERLKIHVPTIRQVGIAFGLGIVLVIILAGASALAEQFGLNNVEVDELSQELYGPFFQSILGVLTVGLAAGLGEEAFFRGALQPRFGRIATAFLFAIMHGNYGLSIVTVAIFIVGYILGIIRDRYNTTTAMITHAVYNSTQALMAYLAFQNPQWFESAFNLMQTAF